MKDLFSPLFRGSHPILLASGSPRRRELLREMGLSFTVLAPGVDEDLPALTPPREGALLLSRRKATAALSLAGDAIVVAADTVVELDGRALGKPESEDDALAMLMALSGRTHTVHTGVAVAYGGRLLADADTTSVAFLPFDEKVARDYIATGEPMDKAGAYGIQGLGGALVASTHGSFDNVVGLPCRLLDRLLFEVTR